MSVKHATHKCSAQPIHAAITTAISPRPVFARPCLTRPRGASGPSLRGTNVRRSAGSWCSTNDDGAAPSGRGENVPQISEVICDQEKPNLTKAVYHSSPPAYHRLVHLYHRAS